MDLLGDVWLIGQGLLDRREQRGVVTNNHEPPGLNDCVDIAFAGDHTFEHLTRELVGQTAVGDQLLDPGDVRRRHRKVRQGDSLLVGDPGELSGPPLAGGRLIDALIDGQLHKIECFGVDQRLHLEVADVPLGLQAGAPHRRHLGQRPAKLLDPFRCRCHRNQIGFGKVAVVLCVLLRPSRRGLTGVLMEMSGFLHHSTAAREHRGLALDLETDGALHAA